MKRRLLLILFFIFSSSLLMQGEQTAQCVSHLRISLLTCSEGSEDVAAAFGHSAIRIVDTLNGSDVVYNYGTYNFYEPDFLLKFLRGDLYYLLSTNSFTNFTRTYSRSGRGVVEREFQIGEEDKLQLQHFLNDNAKPENREYLYDFLLDNCATRIRDIFNTEQYHYKDSLLESTYRKHLRELLGDKYWLNFGIDLILGARVDRQITSQQEMFLPKYLELNLLEYTNIESGSSLLSQTAKEILPRSSEPSSQFVKRVFSPFSVFIVLLFLYLIILYYCTNKVRFHKIFSSLFYVILSIGGAILLFMWFGTNHIWTKVNWNLLWMNPLFLLLLFIGRGKIRQVLSAVLIAGVVLSLLGGLIIPQEFNTAFYPIFILELFLLLPEVVIKYRIIEY